MSIPHCAKCQKPIIEETKYQAWHGLYMFLEILLSEEYIELETYNAQVDRLMCFKP